MQKEMAAFYDKQRNERDMNEAIDKDYYHSRIRKNDGSVEPPKNMNLKFPGDFDD